MDENYKIKEIERLLAMSPMERGMSNLPIELTDIARMYHVPVEDIERINNGVVIDLNVSREERKAKRTKEPEPYDSIKYFKDNLPTIDAALLRIATSGNGNATALKQIYYILGLGGEKMEEVIGISPEERYSRLFEAKQRLQGEGYIGEGDGHSVDDVPAESTLLPEEHGIHHEQEHGEES